MSNGDKQGRGHGNLTFKAQTGLRRCDSVVMFNFYLSSFWLQMKPSPSICSDERGERVGRCFRTREGGEEQRESVCERQIDIRAETETREVSEWVGVSERERVERNRVSVCVRQTDRQAETEAKE